jgi:pimeloyl-ACP methyl ester carboxylesterase
VSDIQWNAIRLKAKVTSTSIVALHGPGGSWNKTWTSEAGYFWLRDLLPIKFASSRILSYQVPKLLKLLKTKVVDVNSLIEELVHKRQSSRRTHTPIIFVGHSFGGNVLKQIYVATHPDRVTRSDFRVLHESIRAYIFLGTPQKSITFEDYGALIRAWHRGIETSLGGNEVDLEEAFNTVGTINEDFLSHRGEELPACCFYERGESWIGLVEVR